MPTRLEQICDALVAHSAGVSGIGATGLLTDVGRMWAEETNTPAAYLGVAQELVGPGPTRSLSCTARLFWHTIVRGDAPTRLFMALYGALRAAVEVDPTIGSLADSAHVTGFDALNTSENIARRTHVADVFIEVEYRTDRGSP